MVTVARLSTRSVSASARPASTESSGRGRRYSWASSSTADQASALTSDGSDAVQVVVPGQSPGRTLTSRSLRP